MHSAITAKHSYNGHAWNKFSEVGFIPLILEMNHKHSSYYNLCLIKIAYPWHFAIIMFYVY